MIYSKLASAPDVETRARLRVEIRRKVERITFWFRRDENTPALVGDPASDLFPFAEVRFAKREMPLHRLNEGSDYEGVKLMVTFEAAPESGVSKQKVEEVKAALRELGLDPDIKS